MMNRSHLYPFTSTENYKGLEHDEESDIEVLRDKLHNCVIFKVFYLIFSSIVLFFIYYIPWSYFKMIKMWTDEKQLMYIILANILFLTLLILLNTSTFPDNSSSASLYVYLSILALYFAFKLVGVIVNTYFLININTFGYLGSNELLFTKFWKQNYKTIPFTLERDFGCCQNIRGGGACTFFDYNRKNSCIQLMATGVTIGLITTITMGFLVSMITFRELYLYRVFLQQEEEIVNK